MASVGTKMKAAMRAFLAVAFVAPCVLGAPARADETWDVENTNQPHTDVEFTLSEGTWMGVGVSPDGATIFFDLLGDIYAMPAHGGEGRVVHGGPAMQRSPRVSPDGQSLLYISDQSGGDNLWISNLDGSDARQVTQQTVEPLTGPAWGADGAFVAAAKMFATADRLHASEIRLFDLGGGRGQIVIDAPTNGENVHEPVFSSDGRYVYYTEKISPPSASVIFIDADHTNYAIMRRDLTSGDTEQLIGGFGGATTPQLSPDDRRIAFVRRVRDRTVLFGYDVETGEQWPVYDELDRDDQADFIGQGLYYPPFDWFPDNRSVAIWAGGKLRRIDMETGEAHDLPFVVNAQHRLTTPVRVEHDLAPESFRVRAIRQIEHSPDGRTLVFGALGRLWIQDFPAGQPRRFSNTELPQADAAFSPDGRRVAYVEWSDERGSTLMIANANGARTRVVLSTPAIVREPRFSADGRTLLYGIGGGDSCLGGHALDPGVYLIAVDGGAGHRITGPADNAIFSPDGERIVFTREDYVDGALVMTLESVDLDGGNHRELAHTLDADTGELRVSPDMRWIAFKDRQNYYLTRFSDVGRSVEVSAASDAFPVTQLTTTGGNALAWSADSQQARWLLGAEIYSVIVDDREVPGEPEATIALDVPSDHPDGTVAFVGGRVITMADDDGVIERGTVIVEGARIVAVGGVDDIAVPRGAHVVDASGMTVMPGMVDLHGHNDLCYYSSSGLTPQKHPSRYADLAYGVTTNYDPYTSELPTYTMSEMTRAGLMVGPRAIDVGMVAYGRSGKSDRVYLPINAYDDALGFMTRRVALGGIAIKSYRQPMRSQRQQLIRAGREMDVMVDVEGESHIYNNITMVLDGHFNVQHNLPVATYYDDLIQLFALSQVSHTPTLIVLFGEVMGENYLYQTTRAWEDEKVRRFVQVVTSGYSPLGAPYGAPTHVRNMTTIHVADELWDIGFRSVARSMRRLDEAGATVTVGSHGQVAGLAMHWEMQLLSEGGMPNARILRAATINGARTLGIDRQVGSIEPGKLADILVLDANPLEDIQNTNSVRYTMVNGRLYDSYDMNEIGNYDRPRTQFYWETGRRHPDIEWNPAWAHQ